MKSLTKSRIISTLFLVFKLFRVGHCSDTLVKGFCGHPGIPFRSQFSPIQNSYNEGETVLYTCDDYISLKQYRKCLNGKWTGLNAICGKY